MHGFVVLEQPHSNHVDYRFEVNGGPNSHGDTGVYNGRQYYKWHIDG